LILDFEMTESSQLYETQTVKGAFVIRFKHEDMLETEHIRTREDELTELFNTTECTRIALELFSISR
jgi:hypothetical protein